MEQGHMTGERERRQRQLETPGTERSSKGDRVRRQAQCQGQKTAKASKDLGRGQGGVRRVGTEGQTWGGNREGWGG